MGGLPNEALKYTTEKKIPCPISSLFHPDCESGEPNEPPDPIVGIREN